MIIEESYRPVEQQRLLSTKAEAIVIKAVYNYG